MNDRYFIVHWLGQRIEDDYIDIDDEEFEDDEYGPTLLRGKLFIKTRGRYVNEEGLLQMIVEQRPEVSSPYIDRIDELTKSDYEDYLRGSPNLKSNELRDPNAPQNFA